MYRGAMHDDTTHATPAWLRALLALELLWWLGASGLSALFLAIVPGFGSPDAPLIAGALALCLAACLVGLVVVAVSLFRRARAAPAQRFGVIHGTLATVAAGPVSVVIVWAELSSATVEVAEVAGSLAVAALAIAAPLAGALLARSSHRLASRIGIGLGAISCPVATAALGAIMTSMAVSGGLTV